LTAPETKQEEGGLKAPGRIAAVAAIVLAAVLMALVVLGDDDYEVRARFQAATQMIPGNLVQVGGRKVGTVESVELTDNGEAELVLKIDDPSVVPLRQGTEAQLKLSSITSVVGRYVDLRIPSGESAEIESGGLIDSSRTTSAVDLDQFFNMFDEKTRKGLQQFVRGNARLYQGQGDAANAGWRFLNPSLVASTRLFRELNRDTPVLEGFLTNSARLVTDIADRRDDLAQLVDRLATTTGAIAREQNNLSDAISQLPPFMRRANTTFLNLRDTLDDLAPLVEESKPVTPRLRAVMAELRPFAREARPTVRNLADLVRSPGKDNDLIDLAKAVPGFRDVAIGPVQRNGAERRGSFAESAESLKRQAPHWAYFRPYSPDFTNWLDDFSHSGIYDANGSASRVATSVNAFAVIGAQLKFVPDPLRPEVDALTLQRGQNNRCPGSAERPAADGTNPWKPTPDFLCDPTQLPPGP
jgi:phospholipid/cholesterol/gamma-HCH transport system substrate-binding protein